jgi:anaerobic dimethyl sulfoxide reductase subunit B (iron-sulfur subunit)
VCPYNAPQFGAEENPKMQKCNLCIDRLAEGMKPACVDACPMEALDSGLMTSLRLKYGSCCETDGFEYNKDLAPSIIIKPKVDTNNLELKKILIVPAT